MKYLALDLILLKMVQAYHQALHTLNNSDLEIKFLSINWYNFRSSFVSWGGSSRV